jgi:hypothetical protein
MGRAAVHAALATAWTQKRSQTSAGTSVLRGCGCVACCAPSKLSISATSAGSAQDGAVCKAIGAAAVIAAKTVCPVRSAAAMARFNSHARALAANEVA